MDKRQDYVLVHGAFHGGWCWERVAKRLKARGGRVLAPTLTGLAERAHLLRPDINLSTHIDDVVEVIERADARDVVLCGHSYGGMVISGVAERVTQRIRALVYLDAFRPEPGKSVWDYTPGEARAAFDAGTENDTLAPIAAKVFKVNEADRAWVDAQCTRHPRATFMERLPDTNNRATIGRKIYVYAAGYGSKILGSFADAAEAETDWERIDLAHGHDLMLDTPDEVANILEAAAR